MTSWGDRVLRGWDDWFHDTTEDERRAWRRWLELHGIDPTDIPVIDVWVFRDIYKRQVSYPAIKRDADGQPMFDRDQDDFIREVRYQQLESPPMPFPGDSS